MILAIYGHSGSGKTTVAEIMARRLQLPVRHCGIAVRAAAVEAGASMQSMSFELHRRVDQETVEWCDQHSPNGGIVEGRFLDSVMQAREDIIFIHLFAQQAERARRMAERSGHALTQEEIIAIDAADDEFRLPMYGEARSEASLLLDTTGGQASQWAEKLEEFARRRMGIPPG